MVEVTKFPGPPSDDALLHERKGLISPVFIEYLDRASTAYQLHKQQWCFTCVMGKTSVIFDFTTPLICKPFAGFYRRRLLPSVRSPTSPFTLNVGRSKCLDIHHVCMFQRHLIYPPCPLWPRRPADQREYVSSRTREPDLS